MCSFGSPTLNANAGASARRERLDRLEVVVLSHHYKIQAIEQRVGNE